MDEQFIKEKLENFKNFVEEISEDKETILEYKDMSFFKLKMLAYTLLIPNRNNLHYCAIRMQRKLKFDDEHLGKFERYLAMFVEYLSGVPVPDQASETPQTPKTYEELLQDLMDDE